MFFKKDLLKTVDESIQNSFKIENIDFSPLKESSYSNISNFFFLMKDSIPTNKDLLFFNLFILYKLNFLKKRLKIKFNSSKEISFPEDVFDEFNDFFSLWEKMHEKAEEILSYRNISKEKLFDLQNQNIKLNFSCTQNRESIENILKLRKDAFSMLDSIKEYVAQTSLLSLNASIDSMTLEHSNDFSAKAQQISDLNNACQEKLQLLEKILLGIDPYFESFEKYSEEFTDLTYDISDNTKNIAQTLNLQYEFFETFFEDSQNMRECIEICKFKIENIKSLFLDLSSNINSSQKQIDFLNTTIKNSFEIIKMLESTLLEKLKFSSKLCKKPFLEWELEKILPILEDFLNLILDANSNILNEDFKIAFENISQINSLIYSYFSNITFEDEYVLNLLEKIEKIHEILQNIEVSSIDFEISKSNCENISSNLNQLHIEVKNLKNKLEENLRK